MHTARRRLLSRRRRAPALLHAVVRVVRDLESHLAAHDILQAQLPLRTVAAYVAEFALAELPGKARVEIALHLIGALARGHRVTLGAARDAHRQVARDVDRDEEAQIARRGREVLPVARGFVAQHRPEPLEARSPDSGIDSEEEVASPEALAGHRPVGLPVHCEEYATGRGALRNALREDEDVT